MEKKGTYSQHSLKLKVASIVHCCVNKLMESLRQEGPVKNNQYGCDSQKYGNGSLYASLTHVTKGC